MIDKIKKENSETAYQVKINNEILDSLVTAGIGKTTAKKVVVALRKNLVSHVSIVEF